MVRFIGREKELEILGRTLKKKAASLVVIRGRRRIGKTRLIQEFVSGHSYVYISGNPPNDRSSAQDQRDAFVAQMSDQLGIPQLSANRWSTIFFFLAQQIQKGRWILVLDEISWIGSKDADFLGELKTAWDLHFSKNSQLVLILCGSVSSWIESNILSSTGFVGRISIDLCLQELSLRACTLFWGGRQVSAHEMLQLLAVTGGVPKYLEEVVPQMTVIDNLKEMCFRQDGILFQEFDRIFCDLFLSNLSLQKEIVSYLVNGPRTMSEIATQLKVSRSGHLSKNLKDLILAGFVKEEASWDLASAEVGRIKRFRLSDNYLRFYLKFILPVKQRIIEEHYKPDKSLLYNILGLQFENLILNNVSDLCPFLDIRLEDIVHAGPFIQRTTKRKSGCQIDLLIQTTHRSLYVCEIKFRSNTIGVDVIEDMKEKINRLARPKGFSIRPVLIYSGHLSPDLEAADYFDYLFDAASLVVPIG